jgi:hypothetical protein
MHDSRPGNRRADPRRERGLTRVAAPVNCQNDRTARHDPARPTPDKRLDNGGQQLGPPRPGLRFLPSKLQSHAPIMPGSPVAAVHSKVESIILNERWFPRSPAPVPSAVGQRLFRRLNKVSWYLPDEAPEDF